MKDPDLQAATASEPLTLEAEYAMQRSWRDDSDKLTFISCLPQDKDQHSQLEDIRSIIGDVNLFIVLNEEDSGDLSLAGEIELMIAQKQNQRQGIGRAALLVFLRYILEHEDDILKEYFGASRAIAPTSHFHYFRAKINETNVRSITLFENIGFKKIEESPDFFGEFELRAQRHTLAEVVGQMEERSIRDYLEAPYPDEAGDYVQEETAVKAPLLDGEKGPPTLQEMEAQMDLLMPTSEAHQLADGT